LRLRIGVLLIVIALFALSLGSAAMTSVTLDRKVTAGTVKSDKAPDVVVKFASLGTYGDLMIEDKDGVVSFDLSKALDNKASGFNPDARFTIGSCVTPVFAITNNSDIAITVTLSGGGTALILKDTKGAATTTIASGATASFYFEIDTINMAASTALGGTLQIRKAA